VTIGRRDGDEDGPVGLPHWPREPRGREKMAGLPMSRWSGERRGPLVAGGGLEGGGESLTLQMFQSGPEWHLLLIARRRRLCDFWQCERDSRYLAQHNHLVARGRETLT
jgi:hypothetical protein